MAGNSQNDQAPPQASVESENAGVHALLIQWGCWVRADRVELATTTIFQKGSTAPTPMITDDEAMRLDRLVAQLKQRRREMGHIIQLFYAYGLGCDRRVGKALHISTNKARGGRRAGLAWIDGALTSED